MELSGNIGTLPNAKSLAFFLTLEDLWISFLGRCFILFVFCCAGLKLSQISNMGFLLESLNDISISPITCTTNVQWILIKTKNKNLCIKSVRLKCLLRWSAYLD